MATIQQKYLETLNQDAIKLDNDSYVLARNAADNGDVSIVKVNSSDAIEFASTPQVGGNDVVVLDGSGKIPSSYIPALALSEVFVVADIAARDALTVQEGDVSIVTDAGAGEPNSYIYDGAAWQELKHPADAVTSVNGQTGVVSLDADDIDDAATTNKFATAAQLTKVDFISVTQAVDLDDVESKALSALQSGDNVSSLTNDAGYAVSSTLASTANGAGASLIGIEDSGANFTATNVEEALSELKSDIASAVGSTNARESFTLSAGDITNGYVDLANTPIAASMHVQPVGGPIQEFGVDYTVSTNRVTFAGDLSTNLAAGDKLIVQYEH